MLQIQKTGANMQSLKKRGNGAVGGENMGSYAIYPCNIVLVCMSWYFIYFMTVVSCLPLFSLLRLEFWKLGNWCAWYISSRSWRYGGVTIVVKHVVNVVIMCCLNHKTRRIHVWRTIFFSKIIVYWLLTTNIPLYMYLELSLEYTCTGTLWSWLFKIWISHARIYTSNW